MEFSKVAALVLAANNLGILDHINISRSSGWITWYYGELKIGNAGSIYFDNDEVSSISENEFEYLKMKMKEAGI